MEKEISSGAMLGIVLIALAAIIGLGFAVFSIAKGTANEGVVNVQDNLGAVGASAFTDYDQKIVTGTQVKSAYDNFQGKTVAILIATKSFISGDQTSNLDITSSSTGSGYFDATGTNPLTVSVVGQTMNDNQDVPRDMYYINYNALLNQDEALTVKNGDLIASMSFNTDVAGTVQFNNIIGGLSKSGNAEYVPTSGRFEARLVKDKSGTIRGVAFKQVGN